MKIIVIAAGSGKRLGEDTKNVPKYLIKVNEKTIMEHQLDVFKKIHYENFIVITGPHKEKFTLNNITYVEDTNYPQHDILGSLMEVSRAVVDALKGRGVDAPFAIQSLVLEDAIAGLDVLAKSQTGSGKTLAFAIPIVERLGTGGAAPAALVLVPTREFGQQVADEFAPIANAKGLKMGVAYGGTSVKEQGKVAARANVLIATPGRLEDLTSRGMVKLVDFGLVKLLQPDESRTVTVVQGRGTVAYTPLEQYGSDTGHTDARSGDRPPP